MTISIQTRSSDKNISASLQHQEVTIKRLSLDKYFFLKRGQMGLSYETIETTKKQVKLERLQRHKGVPMRPTPRCSP